MKLRARRRIGEISRDLGALKPEDSGGMRKGVPTTGKTSKKRNLSTSRTFKFRETLTKELKFTLKT